MEEGGLDKGMMWGVQAAESREQQSVWGGGGWDKGLGMEDCEM